MEVRKPIFLLFGYAASGKTHPQKSLMSFGTSNFRYLKCLVIGRQQVEDRLLKLPGGLVDSKKSPTVGPTVRGDPYANLSI